MFVLKKLFKLRENGGATTAGSSEKPFLEHLEDLRDVILKIVITLVIATIACYIFRGALIDILRQPMEKVWNNIQIEKLPETISPDLWEQAKKVADTASGLSADQQTHLYNQFDNDKLRFYAQTATYYRTALLIEKDEENKKRKAFVKDFPGIDQETKDLLLILLEKQPSAALNAKGSVVYMQSLKPTETFMLAIKLSIFAGIIISFPFLLYFILQFVIPGLKENERKALWPAMIIGFGLFLLGVFFCYFLVLPKALDFFFTYSAGMGVENEWRIGDYITFTTQFTLIFGLAFELPVVVMALVKMGLLSYQTMSNTRSYAVLTIFLVGAIITPTGDALTLSLLAVPMCLLYEMCIWLAYFNQKKELAAEALEEAEIQDYIDRQSDDADDDHGHKKSNITPIPTPVPGRVSTEYDHEDHDHDHNYHDDHHDYDHGHDAYDHDYHGEGAEMDDGEVEDYSKTIHTSSETKDEESKDSNEEEEADAHYEDDGIDYNPGASFEAPPAEEPADKPEADKDKDQ